MLRRIHKKGYTASTVVDFYAYFAFAIIIILFFLIFKFGGGDEIKLKIDYNIEKTDNDLILLNILKSETIFEGQKLKVSDLIIKWQDDPNKYDQILDELVVPVLYKFSTITDKKIKEYKLVIGGTDTSGNLINKEIVGDNWDGGDIFYILNLNTRFFYYEYNNYDLELASTYLPSKTSIITIGLQSSLVDT